MAGYMKIDGKCVTAEKASKTLQQMLEDEDE